MKKTLFTICSVVTVCAVIFLACTKDDNGKNQVDYASKSTVGTGGNPNPNNNPSSGGTVPTSTVPTCSSSLSINSTACTGVSGSHGANTISETGGSCGSAVSIVFTGTSMPASGTYSIVTGSPIAGQCTFSCGSPASGGTITITTGSGTSNKAAFSGIVCGTNTVAGTICY